MEIREGTYFTKTHEYIRQESELVYLVGVSHKLVSEVGNITNIVLPEDFSYYDKKEVFAIIESSSAAAEIHMPLRCDILQINPLLQENPSLLNTDPYGQGWILKVKPLYYNEDNFDFESSQDYICNNE